MLTYWGLGRDRNKEILRFLETGRIPQTTFSNLVGATRFKAVKEGDLRRTRCPKYGKVDTRMRCVQCYRIETPPVAGERAWLVASEKLIQVVATGSPALYQAANKKFGETRTIWGEVGALNEEVGDATPTA